MATHTATAEASFPHVAYYQRPCTHSQRQDAYLCQRFLHHHTLHEGGARLTVRPVLVFVLWIVRSDIAGERDLRELPQVLLHDGVLVEALAQVEERQHSHAAEGGVVQAHLLTSQGHGVHCTRRACGQGSSGFAPSLADQAAATPRVGASAGASPRPQTCQNRSSRSPTWPPASQLAPPACPPAAALPC